MPDLDDMVQQDANTIRRATTGGLSRPGVGTLIYKGLLSLGALSVLFMLVLLPFAGDQKLVPGSVWVGGGIVFIVLFFGLGLLMKVVVGWAEA